MGQGAENHALSRAVCPGGKGFGARAETRRRGNSRLAIRVVTVRIAPRGPAAAA